MSDRKILRSLEPATEDTSPLSVAEVLETGDVIAKELRRLILAALDESCAIGHVGAFNSPWKAVNIRGIRRQAGQAITAWQKVDAAAAEILDLERRMTRGGA